MTEASPNACSASACCCPCKGDMARMSRTIRWMRILLLVIAAFLILAIGIGIGKDQSRRAMGRGMAMAALRGRMPGPMRGPEGPGLGQQPDRPMDGPGGARGRGRN